jgi:HD superfamily phosphohydrolase YqeK
MIEMDRLLTTTLPDAPARRERLAQELARALNAQALYGPFHPSVLRAGEQVAEVLCLDPGAAVELDISSGRGEPTSATRSLASACARHGLGHLVLRAGLEGLEIAELVCLLGKGPEELQAQGGLAAALSACGSEHIVCENAGATPRVRAVTAPPLDSSLLRTASVALEVIQESAQQARVGRMLNAGAARALAAQLADNVIDDRAELLGLLSLQRHDEYTFQHSLNISILALALGMAVGLDRNRLEELGLAALLHDVGKAWVPLDVLRKPGPLDERERALIQHHPRAGAAYLGEQLDMPPAAALVAFQHHLRVDQRGYPRLRWPQPANAYSLIVGIADAYEALTSERPYRRTLPPEQAIDVMLATTPGQFEPRLLRVFAEMLGRLEAPVKTR